MNDLISVLMPVYNVEHYVRDAIESILNQTYTNFEFVIIDDCSTDNTFAICKKYAENDNRIVLIRNDNNIKIEGSLNRGLENCHGKYVVRMDGDDISIPNRLEVMKNYLDEHKDIVLVGSSTETIDSDGNYIGRTTFLDDWNLILKTCCLRTPVVHIWMTYKSIYDELNGYRKLFGSEDYDFILRLISKGYKCTNISDFYGYKIRVNRPGNSGNLFGVRKIKSAKYTVKLYRQRMKNKIDTYSFEVCMKAVKTFFITEMFFSFSKRFLYKAIDAKSNQKYFICGLYLLLSLVSPYQVSYLWKSFKYRLLTGVIQK